MSKSKTKRAHREAKREKVRKLAANHRKAISAAKNTTKPTSAPLPKKPKQKADTTTTTTTAPTPTKSPIQASQKPTIPFGTYDNILLVGEGDFSFTQSLAIHHGCANVTGTAYDALDEVRRKYPSFEAIESELSSLTPPVPLHYGIDATKLSGYKALRVPPGTEDGEGEGGWDIIAFMFPHTGGLSTDVNRQVRANQNLLVGFFEACLEKNMSKQHKHPFLNANGLIIVTLFENPPYTLWNVRDLARHVGLKVRESWRFEWGDYPGYGHVRTLGAIEGGGGWKGEERSARMYVFEKVGNGEGESGKEKKKGKNKRGREESDSEEG